MELKLKKGLLEEMISMCKKVLPRKSFGIVAGRNGIAEELYPLKTNLRPIDPVINTLFESYGEFYHDKDRGFWIDPEEQLSKVKEIERKGQRIIGIYHSHRCLCSVPSQVDMDLHYDPNVLAIIVSLVDPNSPEVKAYIMGDNSYAEIEIHPKEE